MEVGRNTGHLIIRADASAEIGAGHLMRCLALAQNWRNGTVIFVTNCESPALHDRLKKEGFSVVELTESHPSASDATATREVLKNYPEAWCVVDGYHFDAPFTQAIRRNGNRVLVIDDTAHQPFYEADAILNQNINAADLRYHCSSDATLLLGTDYALLRKEFNAWRNFKRSTPLVARKILITMGAGDSSNQTLKALRATEKVEIENLHVKAVIGASNPHLKELEKTVQSASINIELIYGTENMAELQAWADVAVSAAGSTCWELAFMQLPSVLLVAADNQKGIARGLDETGFAINVGWFEQVSEQDLARALNEIASDKLLREKMSKKGTSIVDGRGTERVVQFLFV